MLLSFLANVSRSGSLVVLGDPNFAIVSNFGVVVGLVDGLKARYSTEARAPKWAKVIKLFERDAHATNPSFNKNIMYEKTAYSIIRQLAFHTRCSRPKLG